MTKQTKQMMFKNEEDFAAICREHTSDGYILNDGTLVSDEALALLSNEPAKVIIGEQGQLIDFCFRALPINDMVSDVLDRVTIDMFKEV